MATRAKRQQCKSALANPATRRECAAKAKAMGDQPRRVRRPFDRRLRLARERAQRARQPWDIGLARQQLLEEDRLGFQLAKRRRLARLKRQRHGDRELESQLFQFLGQVVADTARHLPTWLERVDGNPFVPTPESQHATTACWNPDWRPWLLEELPTLMAQQGLAAEVAWDLQHQVVTKEQAARVRAEGAAAKRARVCYESGLCLCRVSDGFRVALLGAFARAMAKALVKADSMGGGDNSARAAADRGQLILCIASSHDDSRLWAHLSSMRLRPSGLDCCCCARWMRPAAFARATPRLRRASKRYSRASARAQGIGLSIGGQILKC